MKTIIIEGTMFRQIGLTKLVKILKKHKQFKRMMDECRNDPGPMGPTLMKYGRKYNCFYFNRRVYIFGKGY